MTTQRLPAGWRDGEHGPLTAAIGRLPLRVRVLVAAEAARSALPVYGAKRPGDGRPAEAIRLAERWVYTGEATGLTDAARAAEDAAWAIRYNAALRDAAWAAGSASV